jgi:hypothetical protein
MTDTTDHGAKAGWHLWLVGGLGVLWNGFGCFDFTMTATRNEAYLAQFPEEMIDYILALPWWVWALWVLGVFGGLAGCLALLARRAVAVPLLGASFVGAFGSLIVGMKAEDAPVIEGTELMPFVIVVIAAGLLGYAVWQSRRGGLR